MIELVLYLVSKLGKKIFGNYLFVYGVIKSYQKKELRKYLFDLAYSEDQYCNVLGQYHFNKYWITSNSKHKFGNPDETISSVLGKNKIDETLLRRGKRIDEKLLERLETNHTVKAIEQDE